MSHQIVASELFSDLSDDQQEMVAGGFVNASTFNSSSYNIRESLNATKNTLALAGGSGPGGSTGGVIASSETLNILNTLNTSQFTSFFGTQS